MDPKANHALTNLSVQALAERGIAGVVLEPSPPMDRTDYNRRGRVVGWLLRALERKWPSVYWNEVAHARRSATFGFPEIPVEKRSHEYLEWPGDGGDR